MQDCGFEDVPHLPPYEEVTRNSFVIVPPNMIIALKGIVKIWDDAQTSIIIFFNPFKRTS